MIRRAVPLALLLASVSCSSDDLDSSAGTATPGPPFPVRRVLEVDLAASSSVRVGLARPEALDLWPDVDLSDLDYVEFDAGLDEYSFGFARRTGPACGLTPHVEVLEGDSVRLLVTEFVEEACSATEWDYAVVVGLDNEPEADAIDIEFRKVTWPNE